MSGVTVADLFATAAVVAGVPETETIAAIRVYPRLDRVEFIGREGIYRTSLEAEVGKADPEPDDRHLKVDGTPAIEGTPGKGSGKA